MCTNCKEDIVDILKKVEHLYRSKQLKVNERLFHAANQIVKIKKKFWKDVMPELNFDEHGRALFGYLKTPDKDSMIREFRLSYGSFDYYFVSHAFESYLSNSNYDKISNVTIYEKASTLLQIDPKCFFEDEYFHFIKKNETAVRVKVTRVLQGCFEIWKKTGNGENYQRICKDLKALRKEGFRYEDLRVSDLSSEKKRIEATLPNFVYDKIINKAPSEKVMISINPLDKLVASGNTTNHITKFNTCWSNNYEEVDDYIIFNGNGAYANPFVQFAVGSHENCGMIYTENNSILNIPNTDFKFNGYTDRLHCWIDVCELESIIDILLEKSYPNYNFSSKVADIIKNRFENIGDANDKYFEDDVCKFEMQNKELNLYCYNLITKLSNSIFLDRIVYDWSDMYILETNRVNYNYNDGHGLPTPMLRCCKCGDEIDTDNDTCIDGDWYCEKCSNKYTMWCEHCNERVVSGSHIVYDFCGDKICVCDDCIDEYYKCDECGRHHYSLTDIESSMYCDKCMKDLSKECSECGDKFKIENICEDCNCCSDCCECNDEED